MKYANLTYTNFVMSCGTAEDSHPLELQPDGFKRVIVPAGTPLPKEGWIWNQDDPPTFSTPPITTTIKDNRDRLWNAAKEFEGEEVSTYMATLVGIGVQSSKPKALAVLAWQKSLWQLYWSRRQAMTNDEPDSMFRFRNAIGNCPHNVNELMAEAGL